MASKILANPCIFAKFSKILHYTVLVCLVFLLKHTASYKHDCSIRVTAMLEYLESAYQLEGEVTNTASVNRVWLSWSRSIDQ